MKVFKKEDYIKAIICRCAGNISQSYLDLLEHEDTRIAQSGYIIMIANPEHPSIKFNIETALFIQHSLVTMNKYKSDAYKAIHQGMHALYKIKAIDKKTMKEFDRMCLNKKSLTG